MSQAYLLDVNLLIALSDPSHLHHNEAHNWFGSKQDFAWATCPITENGFIRIASHPRYPNSPGASATVAQLLRKMCSSPRHVFWTDEISLLEALPPSTIYTHKNVTDLYLLALASRKRGKLATFDRQIPSQLIPGGDACLELL